ncbi:hypothetical protein EMIT07CA2_230019 [Brevibacillus sp. IT-7CA2]
MATCLDYPVFSSENTLKKPPELLLFRYLNFTKISKLPCLGAVKFQSDSNRENILYMNLEKVSTVMGLGRLSVRL